MTFNKKSEWFLKWTNNQKFMDERQQKTEKISAYFEDCALTPKSMLDIGCGLALEAEKFQKKYGTELFLLDGYIDTKQQAEDSRHVGYDDVDNMSFYLSKEELLDSWQQRGLAYTFLDATKDLQIETQLKFDFIYSGKSCGFHYPLNTYLDLIKRHSHADSVIVMDLRKGADQKTDEFVVEKVLIDGEKHDTCVIRVSSGNH